MLTDLLPLFIFTTLKNSVKTEQKNVKTQKKCYIKKTTKYRKILKSSAFIQNLFVVFCTE